MNKKSMRKVLATGALALGGIGVVMTGVGMTQYVSAAPAQNSQTTETQNTQNTQTPNQDQKQGKQKNRPELTDTQKAALEKAKEAAVASLSSEDQATFKTLSAKGHFALTFAERDQFDAIKEKIKKYISEHPVEGMPTPSAHSDRHENKNKKENTLTDAQKTELDRLKAEGIAQLSASDQARLKELDTKERMMLTESENQELHALQEKVMTYVKSKVSFTMPQRPEGKRGGHHQ